MNSFDFRQYNYGNIKLSKNNTNYKIYCFQKLKESTYI